ncbi:uncharacterized protein FOMMEDRAFT_81352, partial [Fomitiporia mediterranea MF3/22]|uniref:uncharacterized protein n=1 Tax=Fomitiporia mediterranea (strain MF3/22) TaxID=694068 RepID=UPI000440797D
KKLNINILKFYTLSIYTSTICQFSMTDSYSTQIVSIYTLTCSLYLSQLCIFQSKSQYKRLKQMYTRTNKQGTVKRVLQPEGRICKIHNIVRVKKGIQ